jgi:DNA polymerase-3 subunit gamma/tau
MLSTSAFNALLKTLEEPPAHIKFIFATTEPHKLPITILSRCQRFDFKRIPLPMVVARLRHIVEQERVAVTDSGLAMIARKGDGSMRDSLSVLDQVLAFCGDQVRDEEIVTLLGVVDRRLLAEASQAVFAKDCRAALDIVTRVDSFGYNMRQFCQELIDHFRNMTILKAVGEAADLPDLAGAELAEIRTQSATVELADLQRHLAILLKAESTMPHTTFPRLTLEMALIKMATLVPVVPVNDILERLRALERGGEGGRVASPSPAWERSPAGRSGGGSPETTTVAPRRPAVPEPQPRQTPEGLESGASAPPEQGREKDDWEGFVAFVKGKKPRLGSTLEHGRPLRVSVSLLEIGFPAGSFQLSSLQDAATLADLQGLAKEFFRAETVIRVVSLSAGREELPLSLSEKKSREKESRRLELHQAATGHPLVAAALEIFEGEITEVSEDKAED